MTVRGDSAIPDEMKLWLAIEMERDRRLREVSAWKGAFEPPAIRRDNRQARPVSISP